MSTRPNRQQQRLARRLQREQQIPYQTALEFVRRGGATPRTSAAAPPQLTVQEGRSACWWCGAEEPLTREHVLARWLVDALHGAGNLDHAYAEPGASEATRTWSAVRPEFKARVVCATCNNGWLSLLEVHAAPILTPLMRGGPGTLSAAQSGTAARWAAKTVLNFQALEETGNRVVDRVLYRQLLDAPVLPGTLRVWAGKVMAQGAFAHSFGGTIQHHGRAARHFTALLTLDRLALMVMGSTDDTMLGALRLGPLANGWIELGRPRAETWPPPFVFDRDQFMAMPQLIARLGHIPPGASAA